MSRPQVVIAGSGGTIGHHIAAAASDRYDVVALTRQVDGTEPAGTQAVSWRPSAATEGDRDAIDALASTLEGARAVINLAGASIADGRLGPEHRQRVRQSRLDSTETLVAAVSRCERPPGVFVQASASGYYGSRGDEVLTEASPPSDDDLLAIVSSDWEDASEPVAEHCRRVVTRFGLVLAKDAPAWQRMVLPIRLFVGGPLGGGEQWWPWVDANDLARAVLFLIERNDASGAFNVSAPEPLQQREFAKRIARRIGRPFWFPAPTFALRLVLGGAADVLVLASQRMIPERLLAHGFAFEYPDFESELDKLLGP